MRIFKKQMNKRALFFLLGLTLLTALFLFLRGPYVSNLMKMAVLTEISEVTGRQFIAQRIYINLIPLYVEAKGVKAYDRQGERILSVKRIKAYPSFSGLFRKRLDLKRIVIIKPQVWGTKKEIASIRKHIIRHTQKEGPLDGGEKKSSAFPLNVRNVIVQRAALSYEDKEKNYRASLTDAYADIFLGEKPEIRISAESVRPDMVRWPGIDVSVKGNAVLDGSTVDIRSFMMKQGSSSLHGLGFFEKGGISDIRVDLLLDMNTLEEAMGLNHSGKGTVYARGGIMTDGEIFNPSLDLKIWGDLRLETLMEALGFGDYEFELSGDVDFNGTLAGPVRELEGKADATLIGGNLYGVEIDRVNCKVNYLDKLLSFTEGDALLYNGNATANVLLKILPTDYYSVDVEARDVDALNVLELARIPWIKLSQGKVTGTFRTAGLEFNPSGTFAYRANGVTSDIWGKARHITGSYEMDGSVVSLDAITVRAESSRLALSGEVDTNSLKMAFDGRLSTGDADEITSLFFEGLEGNGIVDIRVGGLTNSPEVRANIDLDGVAFRKYRFGRVKGEAVYSEGRIDIASPITTVLDDRKHAVWGTMQFPLKESLPVISEGQSSLHMTAQRGKLSELIGIFGVDADVTGLMDVNGFMSGMMKNPTITGKAESKGIIAYGHSVSNASVEFKYQDRRFTVRRANVNQGESWLYLKGFASIDGEFFFNLSSDSLMTRDIWGEDFPISYRMTLDARGKGTYKRPDIQADVKLFDGIFRELELGKGNIKALLKGDRIDLDVRLVNEKLKMKAHAELNEDLPWSAWLDVEQGRYDFLVAPLLKRIPEDLMLSMHGTVNASGTSKTINADVVMGRLNLNMFGQGLVNTKDIRIEVHESDIIFRQVVLQSGSTYLETRGNVDIGRSFDVTFEGSSALGPLLAFVDPLEKVRGEMDFVFSIAGGWEQPSLNGGLSLTDASFGVKGLIQSFENINVFAYFDDGKAVFKEVRGAFGGGELDASGAMYFDGFRPGRFYLDTRLSEVVLSPSPRFIFSLGGNVLFKGTLDEQSLMGEIRINRARYVERVEWKSRLLDGVAPRAPESEPGRIGLIGLNLKVSGEENIMIDNNLAKAALNVDLVVKGTVASPRVYGRLSTEDGKVYFRNNDFRINSATADYADDPPSRPYVRVNAETAIQGYQITLNVEGKSERYDMTLSSDPPLDEVDILALMTVGKTIQSSEGLESELGAAEAASFLTGEFQDVAEERIRRLTGFDRVYVDPYVSKTTGSVTPRVTVSKELVEDKLYVTYSKPVGTDEQEIKLEYLLNRNVSFESGQDERGSFGGDIKFRLRFK
jgi:translocation and assembly module TamB